MNHVKRYYVYLLSLLIIISGCSYYYLTKEQKKVLVEILEILNTTITETEKIISRKPDPTSPYRDIADKLKNMREHINRIRQGDEPYNSDVMNKYSDEIIGIQTNIQNPVDRVLGVDVFFGPGKYKISDFSVEGKKFLDVFAADIIELQVKKLREIFPDNQLIIVIKAIGYADEMPLSQWFAEEMKKDINIPIPEDSVEKRKLLNKELSFRRAQSIAGYVKIQIEKILKIENVIIDNPLIIGLGEVFPYSDETVTPPYKAKDKRRRICKLHGNVFIISK